jgi:hypothetical protein
MCIGASDHAGAARVAHRQPEGEKEREEGKEEERLIKRHVGLACQMFNPSRPNTTTKQKIFRIDLTLTKQEIGNPSLDNRVRSNPSLLVPKPKTCHVTRQFTTTIIPPPSCKAKEYHSHFLEELNNFDFDQIIKEVINIYGV